MPYTLAFQDRFRRVIENVFTRDSAGVVPFASIPDDVSTKITYQWTGKQFTKLLSAVMVGADLAFPEQADDIIFDLIKGVHLPPDVDPEGDCVEYLPSAPFIKFYPDNPYVGGDAKDGWWNEAWYQWSDFFSLFPDWAEDWIGGAVGGLLEYQDTDVLCNIASLAYPTWGAFFDAGGVFPKIEIKFSGTGQINVSLLSFPLGGKAIIELDNEPNVLDILTGGVLDPAAFMIELNRDILSFPPQEYPLIVIPIEVTTSGEHTLYINFIPVVNDETTFLGFGGGIRSIEMCGFAEVGDVGIEQIFWDGCALKIINGGIESTVVTAEEIQACMDIPEGGGGGIGNAVKIRTLQITIPAATTFTATSYTNLGSVNFSHTPTYTKMLMIADNHGLSNSSGANDTDVRWVVDGNAGVTGTRARVHGSAGREAQWSDHWAGLTAGVAVTCQLQGRVSAGTGTISDNAEINITIIEFDDIEALFVEDVRYSGGVLEKKIGGVWLDVVDIDALIAPIQSLASAANAAAAAAQADADIAIATNSAQQVVINNHETRIDTLEDDVEQIKDIDIPQINLTLADHETRIDALESAPIGDSKWGVFKLNHVQHLAGSLNPSQGIYFTDNGSTWDINGWQPNVLRTVRVNAINGNKYGAALHLGIGISVLADGGASRYWVKANFDNEEVEALAHSGTGASGRVAWLSLIPNNQVDMVIEVREEYTGVASNWRLSQVNYLCVQVNPFTGVIFP
jgi:hypothetical protein